MDLRQLLGCFVLLLAGLSLLQLDTITYRKAGMALIWLASGLAATPATIVVMMPITDSSVIDESGVRGSRPYWTNRGGRFVPGIFTILRVAPYQAPVRARKRNSGTRHSRISLRPLPRTGATPSSYAAPGLANSAYRAAYQIG